MIVTNLFAFRATHAADLLTAEAPVGPQNTRVLRRAAMEAELVVVAWGHRGDLSGQAARVMELLRNYDLHCLGVTDAGQPRHPLYCRRDTQLSLYRAAMVDE